MTIHKDHTPAEIKAGKKELEKEPLKQTLQAKSINQGLAILAQECLDLSADLKSKGAPSHSERLQELSDMAQELLTEQGIPDKRAEPELSKVKKKVTRFNPVRDTKAKPTPMRKIIQFNPVKATPKEKGAEA